MYNIILSILYRQNDKISNVKPKKNEKNIIFCKKK